MRQLRRPYYGWVLVAVLGLVTIVAYGTTQYLFGVLVVPVSAALGASRARLSVVYSIGIAVAAVLAVPVGRVVDRFGARAPFMAGSVAAGASLLLLSRAADATVFGAVWGLGVGVAMALTLYPVSFVLVANWFVRRRGAAMALLTTIGGFSSPIYVPLAAWLIAAHGWRAALVVLAMTQLALVPVQGLAIRRRPEDRGLGPDGEAIGAAAQVVAPGAGATLGGALRRPAFWLLTAAGAAGMASAAALQVHQIPYLISRGEGGVGAASIAGLIGLASVPGRFLLNLLSQRMAPQILVALSYGAMAAGTLVLLLGRSTPAFVAYALVYGAGYGAVNPLRASVMADHFGRRAFGAITGTQNVAVMLCAALGPFLAGLAYDAGRDYGPALLAMAAVTALAALATAFTPRP